MDLFEEFTEDDMMAIAKGTYRPSATTSTNNNNEDDAKSVTSNLSGLEDFNLTG